MLPETLGSGKCFTYEQLLAGLEQLGITHQSFSTKTMALYFGISVYKARYCLNLLYSLGLVERSENQQGRKVVWTLC